MQKASGKIHIYIYIYIYIEREREREIYWTALNLRFGIRVKVTTFIDFSNVGRKKIADTGNLFSTPEVVLESERFIRAAGGGRGAGAGLRERSGGDNIKTSSGFLFLRRRTAVMPARYGTAATENVSGFCVISDQGAMKRLWQIKTTLFPVARSKWVLTGF
jgi:hypothetical protein